MPTVVLELHDGGRFRRVRNVHRASNGIGIRVARNRLAKRGRPFLEMNPVEMNQEQRERLTRVSNCRTRSGLLIDLSERRIVSEEEVDRV